MGVCESVSWVLLAPLISKAIPGLAIILYPVIGFLAILGILFVLSKMNRMPLIGVFASFVGDVLIKVWLSVGFIVLIVSIFCIL